MSPTNPHRRRAGAATAVAAVLAAPLLAPVPAHAAPCNQLGQKTGSCNLNTRIPGGGGGGGGGGGSGGGGGGSGPVLPPPPEGLTADEATDIVGVPGGGGAPPPPAAPPTADLVAAAQAATEYPTPTVHTAPDGKTYVRVRTSLWIDGFDDVQTRPITVGAQTVQLVATPKSVTWNLGEKTIVCDDAGSKDGKSCNYTYQRASASQPGGSYQITASITWDVAWTCEGADCDSAGGSLGVNSIPSAPTPLVVSEIQTNTGQ